MIPTFRGAPAALACAAAGLLAGCFFGGDDDAAAPPAYAAEIRRTSYGVPHVLAADEKGLGFGLGYAYAQDNLCLLADALVTVNGERSRFFGPQATYMLVETASQSNLTSDFYFRQLNDAALVQAAWAAQPADLQDMMTGYAAGYNRLLADLGTAGTPEACRGQPWLRPITALDLLKLQRRYAVFASGSNFIDAFYAAQPPTAATPAATAPARAAAAADPARVATALSALADGWRPARGVGSNGVALGRDATESGAGLLLINPHFPWNSIFRFYQMHLTIPGKVDVMGAALGGLPVVNVGFNRQLAWTHTVNTSTHFTLFALQLDPTDPTKYVVDGQTKAMTSKQVAVEVPTPGGGTTTLTRTFWSSEMGPVLALPGTLDWTTTTAYALGDANADNDRMAAQWWALNKAASLDAFRASLETTVGIPWVNTVAVDKAGTAYMGDVTTVPNVSAAKEAACIPAPFVPLKAQKLYVLAGSTAACRWDVDPAAPAPGLMAGAKLPTLVRSDFVQNSNDSAWMSNPAQPLVGFPSIVSADGAPLGGRTRLGLTQIADRLSSADGRPGNRFSAATLQSMVLSNRSYFAGVLLDDLRSACVGAPAAVAPACAVIAGWDGTADLASVGWPLFAAWKTVLDASGVDYWRVPFSAADPVRTPRGLRLADPAVVAAARQALVGAMQALAAQGIDPTKRWGDLQVAVKGARRIPIHGGAALDDIYNAIASVPLGDGQLGVVYGSSIVLTVSFDGATPRAQGFLTFSQSTDPASPWFADQTQRFSDKAWITYPFTDDEIRADPAYRSLKLVQQQP